MPLDSKFPAPIPSRNIGRGFAILQENECNVVNVVSDSKVNRKYNDMTILVTGSLRAHPSPSHPNRGGLVSNMVTAPRISSRLHKRPRCWNAKVNHRSGGAGRHQAANSSTLRPRVRDRATSFLPKPHGTAGRMPRPSGLQLPGASASGPFLMRPPNETQTAFRPSRSS